MVTTTFGSTDQGALAMAAGLGARVRLLNPGAGSYHPKVYLGHGGGGVQAVVGSANLTGGLATNLEAGVWMKGSDGDAPLVKVAEFAEQLWADPRAVPWQPSVVAEGTRERLEPELRSAIVAAWREDPVFLTLGRTPAENRVVDVTPEAVFVETERARLRGAAQPVDAWMLNLAWSYLKTHGELANTVLLHDLRVHRSSAVCAILARLPGVEQAPGRKIVLRWAGEG